MIQQLTHYSKLSLAFILLLAAGQVVAETSQEKGLSIATEADKRDTGFNDSVSEMTMILRNKQGDESLRSVRVKTLEVIGDGDKGLSIFDAPADVKGTAFLSYSHSQKPDEQWLYLPALKRVKRISSANKSGPFMGSEFAYEDIASQEVDKYTYDYLRDESIKNTATFVIERKPTYKHSGYTRQIVWIDQQRYVPVKTEFYDRKNTLLKTLDFKDYRQYKNKFWRAHDMHMQNHVTGKSTRLTWTKYAFKTGLSERDFHKTALKRIR